MAADDPTTDASVATEADPAPALDHGVPVTSSRGQRVLHPTHDELVSLVGTLRDEGWLMCLDVTAVDYLSHPRTDLLHPPSGTGRRPPGEGWTGSRRA